MTKLITSETLKKWSACANGYKRFCELLPDGATLKDSIEALVADGHNDWGYWLFQHCQKDEYFKDQTLEGYRNTGDRNTGDRNTGNRNTGDWNTGNRNTGYRNTGDRNTGYMNTGNMNTGNMNTGDWNTGNRNTGYMNTITPEDTLVFNKKCKWKDWENAEKPDFMFFYLTEWVYESDMTDAEKIEKPLFYVQGGYLKSVYYKDAWRNAWDSASDRDKDLLKALPNFDAEVFKDISGIDVNEGTK